MNAYIEVHYQQSPRVIMLNKIVGFYATVGSVVKICVGHEDDWTVDESYDEVKKLIDEANGVSAKVEKLKAVDAVDEHIGKIMNEMGYEKSNQVQREENWPEYLHTSPAVDPTQRQGFY